VAGLACAVVACACSQPDRVPGLLSKAGQANAARASEAQAHGVVEKPGYTMRRFVEPERTRLQEPGVWFPTSNVTPERTYQLYLPVPAPAGPLPLVVIAPAGSRLFHGMRLGAEDSADTEEHVPWVRAGFVVVAYSVDGALTDADLMDATPAADLALERFEEARAGVDNTRAALDLAFAQANIDRKRVFAVGHSSAATLALLAATVDDRIKRVVAFAPATDVEHRLGAVFEEWQRTEPEWARFITWSSPMRHVSELHVPVYLFFADDDEPERVVDMRAFAAAMHTGRGKDVFTEVTAPTGGHYDAMLSAGIPGAIAWAKGLDTLP
jgi:dienelactone hydrolase